VGKSDVQKTVLKMYRYGQCRRKVEWAAKGHQFYDKNGHSV